MQYTIAAVAAAALFAGASAQNTTNPTGGVADGANGGIDFQATQYDTVVVNAYVTTCPFDVANTKFAYNGVTYSATGGQAVTVTNCPCTVTAPAGTIPSGATIATAPLVTSPPSATAPATNQNNGGASNGTTVVPFTGGANKQSGAGLAAILALAAYAL